MSGVFFNGVTITVENTDESFHTLRDWGLYVINTDYIKEPEQYTKYIEVPGRNGLLDVSEIVSGRQTYTNRQLSIELSGVREKKNWDSTISAIRNKINGRVCKLTFDNDRAYYWRGRVTVKNFESELSVGKFILEVKADPYKYDIESTTEPWHWDPFNFITGVIRESETHNISGSGTVVVPSGSMNVVPELIVSHKTSASFTVTYKGKTYSLNNGTNRIPSIVVNGDEEVSLEFIGTASVQIVYRGGSL